MSLKSKIEKLERITGSSEEKSYFIIKFYVPDPTCNKKDVEMIQKLYGCKNVLVNEFRGGRCIRMIRPLSEEGIKIIADEGVK
jgi:hypothetical protein